MVSSCTLILRSWSAGGALSQEETREGSSHHANPHCPPDPLIRPPLFRTRGTVVRRRGKNIRDPRNGTRTAPSHSVERYRRTTRVDAEGLDARESASARGLGSLGGGVPASTGSCLGSEAAVLGSTAAFPVPGGIRASGHPVGTGASAMLSASRLAS